MSGLRIAVVSDSPARTTGYGVVTDQACRALLAAGHRPTVFGFKDTPESPERQAYPCDIVPIDPFEAWHPKLRSFVVEGRFDVLCVYIDAYCLEEVMGALHKVALPPSCLYAIFDGLPVYGRLLDVMRRFDNIMVTTRPGADYLASHGIRCDAIAPPGVDRTVFRRLDRQKLRSAAGLQGHRVIGVFGRNTQRKQQPKILQALAKMKASGEVDDLAVYFHCATRGYWDLEDLALRYDVRERVIFADDLQDETRGVPLRGSAAGRRSTARIPEQFGYVERLNLCDLVVNAPHSGDFEQVLIEAPACGTPVAGTDDEGIMRAALGPGLPLAANVPDLGNTGQSLHYVDLRSIIDAVRGLEDERLSRAISDGEAWADAHGWDTLHREIVALVERTVGGPAPGGPLALA